MPLPLATSRDVLKGDEFLQPYKVLGSSIYQTGQRLGGDCAEVSYTVKQVLILMFNILYLPEMVPIQGPRSEFPERGISPSRSRTRSEGSCDYTGSVKWAHAPARLTLTWLLIGIPLVVWVRCQLLLSVCSLLTRNLGRRIRATATNEYAWRFPPLAVLGALRNSHANGLPIWLEGHRGEERIHISPGIHECS